MTCKIKILGGSKYIIVNSLIVDELNLKEDDLVLVDFKKKIEE